MCLSVLKFASFASPPFTAVKTNLPSPSTHLLLPLSLRWWSSMVDVCWRSMTLSSVPTSWHCTRRVTSLPRQVETHLQYRNSLTIYKCLVPMATRLYTQLFAACNPKCTFLYCKQWNWDLERGYIQSVANAPKQ